MRKETVSGKVESPKNIELGVDPSLSMIIQYSCFEYPDFFAKLLKGDHHLIQKLKLLIQNSALAIGINCETNEMLSIMKNQNPELFRRYCENLAFIISGKYKEKVDFYAHQG